MVLVVSNLHLVTADMMVSMVMVVTMDVMVSMVATVIMISAAIDTTIG